MRRTDTALLHGPWTDADPTPDDQELADLARAFAGQWIIWRAVNPSRTPGAWCAHRADSRQVPAGVSAESSEGLWRLLQEADR